jgi:hypothetical protein
MPHQPSQYVRSSPSARLLAIWTSGSKLFASVGGFGISLVFSSFKLHQMANGLADFVDMKTCNADPQLASLFILSADSKNTLSWYEMDDKGPLKFIQSLQSDSNKMIRCRTFSVDCDSQIVALACNDGIFVVKFSLVSRSLFVGMPLLAGMNVFSSHLSSITSLSFVSRIGLLPFIIAASYSKGFICSLELLEHGSSVNISGITDYLLDEFPTDALNPLLSLRGITAISNSLMSTDNIKFFGALSVSPPRFSLFQVSSSGKLEIKSYRPALLSRFVSAKELAISVVANTSLLKVDVGNGACTLEQDQTVQLSVVFSSETSTKLFSGPVTIDSFGMMSATLTNYSLGLGLLIVTATDSLGASTSSTVNVVVDSHSIPRVTVNSPIVTVFVNGTRRQTILSVLSSNQPIGATVVYVVNNVTNPSMFSITPVFSSMGHLAFGTTATESISEVTVVSRSYIASRVFESEPVRISIFFRLINRPPVPNVLKQVSVLMNTGPFRISNVVSCNMSSDGKDVGQVLLRYDFISIEEQTDSARETVSPWKIPAIPRLTVDGTLSLAFATDVFGHFVLYFTATDSGGVISGGVDTSQPFMINVVVLPPTDVPVFALPNNAQSIDVRQNSGFNSARFLVSPGLSRRNFASIIHVNATIVRNSHEDLISNLVAGVDGTLNFTVKSGFFGSAIVKLGATDSTNLSGSAEFTVNVLNTDNIRPSIVVMPVVALSQNPSAFYVVSNFVLSISVGDDAFEQSNQVITSIDVVVDDASTAPGFFLTSPTVNSVSRFLTLNTRPGVFGRFVLKISATDSGYSGNVSPVSIAEGFIFAAPVILKVVPDILSPTGGDVISVNGMHFGS